MGTNIAVWTFNATIKRNCGQENMAKKEVPEERNWISSDSSTNECHKDYVKARIDKTQPKTSSRLCGDREETTNHISIRSKYTDREY